MDDLNDILRQSGPGSVRAFRPFSLWCLPLSL